MNPMRIFRDADYDYYENYDYGEDHLYEDPYGCDNGEGYDYSDPYYYDGSEGYDYGEEYGYEEGGYDEEYGSQDPYADWSSTEYDDPSDDCGCDGGEDQGGFDPGCEG